MTDIQGISLSYSVGAPILAGGRVFMHGTRSVSQAVRDWPYLPLGWISPSERQFRAFVQSSSPNVVVGHSLGASWASRVAKDLGIRYRGYGRPLVGNPVSGDHLNWGDPVTWLGLTTSRTPRLGHTLSSYI